MLTPWWVRFQSLIWVACPTGLAADVELRANGAVSIPHMGCMPYGQNVNCPLCYKTVFQSLIWVACPTGKPPLSRIRNLSTVSIPHMGCMPYGLDYWEAEIRESFPFQSLIWVACPTGVTEEPVVAPRFPRVSIPHMGCMPYGRRLRRVCGRQKRCFNPSYGLHALRARAASVATVPTPSFNPSYGLHALRATGEGGGGLADRRFNPSYGLHALRA